jgi:hypothetical protein
MKSLSLTYKIRYIKRHDIVLRSLKTSFHGFADGRLLSQQGTIFIINVSFLVVGLL